MRKWTAAAAAVQEDGETMATAPDRRVRRTRKALQDALLDLMIEKGYEAITIQDLIDRADVGRSTFYTHYTDKDELLQDGFAEMRSVIGQPTADQPAARRPLRFSLPLLRHVQAHQRLGRALYGRPGRATVLQQIEEILADVVRAELAALPADEPASRIPQEAIVRYTVGAYLALLQWWLATDTPMSPEDLDKTFQTLMAPGIRTATRGR